MTTPKMKPFVLHVDDEPDDLRPWVAEVQRQERIDIRVYHPQDITAGELEKASLVLVDFKIEKWTERDSAPALALRPPNGLAVLATLQEKANEFEPKHAQAYALYTAVIGDIARELVHQPHIIARAHNLEWIFEKNGLDQPILARAQRVADLAEAVQALPQVWPSDATGATKALHEWLSLDTTVPWSEAAAREVRRCRPPIHEFAEHTHGLGVVRWALHKILPYPAFLIDDAHFAARLRVSLPSLKATADSAEFRQLFGAAAYKGQLANFIGRRWWRAGVENAIFEATADSPGDLDVLREALTRIPNIVVEKSPRLFVVLGAQFKTKDSLATEENVVEVRPDDWPPFADEAWSLRADLDDVPELKAVAVEDDL